MSQDKKVVPLFRDKPLDIQEVIEKPRVSDAAAEDAIEALRKSAHFNNRRSRVLQEQAETLNDQLATSQDIAKQMADTLHLAGILLHKHEVAPKNKIGTLVSTGRQGGLREFWHEVMALVMT